MAEDKAHFCFGCRHMQGQLQNAVIHRLCALKIQVTGHGDYLCKTTCGDIRVLDTNGRSCCHNLISAARINIGIPTESKTHNGGSALQTEAQQLPAIDQRRMLAGYPSNRVRRVFWVKRFKVTSCQYAWYNVGLTSFTSLHYPGGKHQFFWKTDTACCKRLGTWNDIYICLGSQSRCTTFQIDYSKLAGSQ